MSLRHVLLGLLSENSGHGYALRKEFVARLGHFRDINEGQLYTELARMEQDGLVKREVVVPDKGPARKLLHITAKGRRTFRQWLLSDALENEGVLYDFIQGYPFFTKCTFLQHLEPARAAEKIDRQCAILEKKRKAYAEILPRMERRGVDPVRVRILAFGLEEMEHRVRWLEALKTELLQVKREVKRG
ncbi:MAG: PadR family transcriptional regulator [bacterium]